MNGRIYDPKVTLGQADEYLHNMKRNSDLVRTFEGLR